MKPKGVHQLMNDDTVVHAPRSHQGQLLSAPEPLHPHSAGAPLAWRDVDVARVIGLGSLKPDTRLGFDVKDGLRSWALFLNALISDENLLDR